MKENKFIILICEYNTAPYIRRCLDSIMNQQYWGIWDVVVIDDCSTDGTWEIIEEYPFSMSRNMEKADYYFSNFIRGIKSFSSDKEDIIVLVGADDYLSDDGVLSYLNEVYNDPMIYMTYGQFIPLSGIYGAYCKPIPDTRTYRKKEKWLASHLITFKRKIWDLIKDEDFKIDGHYSNFACDASFMYPMIEMCGERHIKFIERIMYVYNDLNPNSITNAHPKESKREAEYFKNKPSYPEL